MASCRNYKAYLKKWNERIGRDLEAGKYKDEHSALEMMSRIKFEMKRKDRKKMNDISCDVLSDENWGY